MNTLQGFSSATGGYLNLAHNFFCTKGEHFDSSLMWMDIINFHSFIIAFSSVGNWVLKNRGKKVCVVWDL